MGKRKISEEIADAIEADYIDGMSTYEIGDKYGIHHATVSKLMKKRGHTRGRGFVCTSTYTKDRVIAGAAKGHETQRLIAEARIKELLAEQDNGIELAVFVDKSHAVFECGVCGTIFEHTPKRTILCPSCKEASRIARRQSERERKAEREAERASELAREKRCEACGGVFHSSVKTQKYCSERCSRRAKRKPDRTTNHRKRARVHGVEYTPGITLEKVIERDGGICQLCGEPCDASDLSWGTCGPLYPSIDHRVPLSKGGPHTWGNVQLAHMICNSFKRDM